MFRPLSPHLFIYKPQFSSVLSASHRITGVVLTLAFLFIIFVCVLIGSHISFYPIYVLACALAGQTAWAFMCPWAAIGVVLFSFFYHYSSGIRHLIWDLIPTWAPLSTKSLDQSSYVILFVCSLPVWGFMYFCFGAL